MPHLTAGFVRKNGWERPLHPQQIIALVLLTVLPTLYFGAVAASVDTRWRAFAVVVPAVLLTWHASCLLICTGMDPADPGVQYTDSPNRPAVIDRSERKHVIEDCHCFFCQVQVTSQAKHCSACNKCVGDFDHHCRWMNNCVGGRTYRLFFTSIASGALGALFMSGISIFVFVTSFAQPSLLDTRKTASDEHEFRVFGQMIPHAAHGVLVLITAVLLSAATIMLGHLTGFHIFLFSKHLSTYGYIKLLRERETEQREKDAQEKRQQQQSQHQLPAPVSSRKASSGHRCLPCCSGKKSASNKVVPEGDSGQAGQEGHEDDIALEQVRSTRGSEQSTDSGETSSGAIGTDSTRSAWSESTA